MRKIEHIGIAVKDLDVSNALFEKLFGAPAYKSEEVASEGVTTSFFLNGPNKIELLAATNPDSPIAKFIEKKAKESITLHLMWKILFQKLPDYNKKVLWY